MRGFQPRSWVVARLPYHRAVKEERTEKRLEKNAHTAWGVADEPPSRALAPLYRVTFLFGLACGISLALTPLFLDKVGFGKSEMGSLALFFAAGLVTFSIPVSTVLRRFGAKTTLAAALVGYAACVALFPHMSSFASIAAVRFLDGAFSICIWVSSETLVLSRADDEHKGHLTSLYAIWLASGYVAGPAVSRALAAVCAYEGLFSLAGVVAALAALYVSKALRPSRLSQPGEKVAQRAPAEKKEGAWFELLLRIKTSCFAAFTYGYFQSAVVLFLPIYLIEAKAIAPENTIVLPGLFCLGMLLFSNFLGRLADQMGHLLLITGLSIIGMACVFGFVWVDHYLLMCLLVFLAGATLASMSPIALALTGVLVPRGQLSRANSLYNTFYASGILLGPPVSSLIFSSHGGGLMLYHLAALWGAFIAFAVVFWRDDPASNRSRLGRRPHPISVEGGS